MALTDRLINRDNSVIKDTNKCSLSCHGSCAEKNSVCDSCVEKGVFSKNSVLRLKAVFLLLLSFKSETYEVNAGQTAYEGKYQG